jgi:hypothetical protein
VIAVVSRAAPHAPSVTGKLDHRMVRLRPRCARCPRLGAA